MFFGPVSPLASLFLQSSAAQEKKTSNELPWWGYLIILLFLILILWKIYHPQKKEITKAPSAPAEKKTSNVDEIINPMTEESLPAKTVNDEPFDTEATDVEPGEFKSVKTATIFEPPDDELPEITNDLLEPDENLITPTADTQLLEDQKLKETMAEEDLTLIEGIGPKIQTVLKAAGIKTFLQLSELKAEQIKEILTTAGIRLGDLSSWPEQAHLAALGKMDELKSFQDKLSGGRKV